MSVSRPGEMAPTKTTPKALKPILNNIVPITPSQTHEPSALQLLSPNPPSYSPEPHQLSGSVTAGFGSDSVPVSGTVRRRSFRLLLASQMDFAECPVADSISDRCCKSNDHSCANRNRLLTDSGKVEKKVAGEVGGPGVGYLDNEEMDLVSSGSGIRVLEPMENIDEAKVEFLNELSGNGSNSGSCGSKSCKAKGKRELSMSVDLNGFESRGDERSKGFLNLRSGKRILKRGMDSANREDKTVEKSECRGPNDDDLGNGISIDEDGASTDRRGRKMRKEDKGKKELGKDDLPSTENAVHMDGYKSADTRQSEGGDKKGKRKLCGGSEKGNITENVDAGPSCGDLLPNVIRETEVGLESNMKYSGDNRITDFNLLKENAASQGQEQLRNIDTREHGSRRNEYMERFRDIARENASRFAHFATYEEHDGSSDEAKLENEIEDWPGPFSTAMKIIKDRAMKSMKTGGVSSENLLPVSIKWVPKRNQGQIGARFPIPSLQELCLNILAKNADAIVSLDNVPDAQRHKLSQMLCDSRKMNSHFFELLVSGSPTEIRLRDCSWMTEEQFTKSFQMCNTTGLVVLQLDQCGRCMPDYVLLATLAQARQLPRLTSLSLSGACRLSDAGLRSLVSSAPALQSINLSQCSLLTSTSLYILADSLGSLLKELYLDDCQSIDAALIVPALKKLDHLEVLSVAGIQTISDDFIKDYIIARGRNMKELVLKDCVKLTDLSMNVIAEHCPGLCALDLMNLSKLTDSSMVYLTNGCRVLQTLKLCRNLFSDEAVAAFMETTGESLKELSLNNVKKVGHHTALSLANHAKNLHTLDLSWCRNLTDNALGLIVDSCVSLRLLKLFGCTQITDVFLNGHSNAKIQIIGLKMSPILQHVSVPDSQQSALHYSSI